MSQIMHPSLSQLLPLDRIPNEAEGLRDALAGAFANIFVKDLIVSQLEDGSAGFYSLVITTYSSIGIKPGSEMERVTSYVYNSNNTISFEQYEYHPDSEPELLKTGTITMQNGEISTLQVVKEFDPFTANYTYDDKNSIFKNVEGYDKLIFTHIIGEQSSLTLVDSLLGGIAHNFTNNGEFQYTYNSDNYPKTADQGFFGTVLHTYEFFY